MAGNRDTFERFRQKGLDARRAGQWDSARVYLLEAARAMAQLGKDAQTPDLAEARLQTGKRLLDLARDCERAAEERRQRPNPMRSNSSRMAGAEHADEVRDATAADWIVRDKPNLRFDQIAGLDEVKEEIRLKMIYPFVHPELAERFRVSGGGGVLLYGPPGTGKTMLARATASEIEATFFRVTAADVLSKWVGEAEQNIKKLFEAARAAPRSIIFIDEIEALVPARGDDGSSVMQRVVPQILQEVEGFGDKSSILLMGATNLPWQLDPAVLRPGRFDEKIYIPLPDRAARQKLLELYLENRPLNDDVDFGALSERLDGYSGADIKYLCDRAATIPFLQSVNSGKAEEITLATLADVIADTPPSVGHDALRRFEEWSRQATSA